MSELKPAVVSGTITDKEILHLSDLIMIQESASLAVTEALKAYKEKYGLDASTLRQFAKSRFGDPEKHNEKVEKHQQFVELNEQFQSL